MTKVLIVEDDTMISEVYERKFKEAGFEVKVADSGERALETVRKEPFDAILLDLIMPKMDGFEVIRNIRSGDVASDIKIMVASNLGQKEDRDRAIKMGANGFIIKSDFSPGDLVKEFSRLLNQQKEEERNASVLENLAPSGKEKNDFKKILLIEDEEVFLEMFGDKFRQEGYQVEVAQNGAWGLKEALEKDFDIFIVDMVMPAMTGEEIIARIKSDEKKKNIPIIALSASVENQVESRVRELGVNEFFVKTQVVPSELVKKVEELIGK